MIYTNKEINVNRYYGLDNDELFRMQSYFFKVEKLQKRAGEDYAMYQLKNIYTNKIVDYFNDFFKAFKRGCELYIAHYKLPVS